jgi:predicted dehydrogenase
VNIGVIGTGGMGLFWIEKIRALDIPISKVYGHRNRERLEGISFAETVEEVIESSDCVLAVAPPEANHEIALKSLSMSKPIFLEKPMTTSIREADNLRNAVEKYNGMLMVGHQWVYGDNFNDFFSKDWEFAYVVNSRHMPFGKFHHYWNIGVHFIAVLDLCRIDDFEIHLNFRDYIDRSHDILLFNLYNSKIGWTDFTSLGDPYANELTHFIHCIETNSTPLTDVEHGYNTISILQNRYGEFKYIRR